MLGFITTRRYRQDTDALRAETARLRRERDAALEERDAFKTSARTAAEKFTAADAARQQLVRAAQRGPSPALDLGNELIEGGRTGLAVDPVSVAARERDRARALEQRLAELQAANERCTCGGGTTPHTPRLCKCGHSHHAHTVPAPHSCFAHGQTCPCKAYQQLPHDEAVAQLARNRQAAAERKPKPGEVTR